MTLREIEAAYKLDARDCIHRLKNNLPLYDTLPSWEMLMLTEQGLLHIGHKYFVSSRPMTRDEFKLEHSDRMRKD